MEEGIRGSTETERRQEGEQQKEMNDGGIAARETATARQGRREAKFGGIESNCEISDAARRKARANEW